MRPLSIRKRECWGLSVLSSTHAAEDFEKSAKHRSSHIITIPTDLARDARPSDIMRATGFTPYRYGPKETVCLNVPASELNATDIQIINDMCDQQEGAKNRRCKKEISGAISSYFNEDQNFRVVELGCGHFPIADYLPKRDNARYHGIEIDKKAIADLSLQGYSVSGWDDALMKHGPKQGETSITVGIYSLQFMVNNMLPMKLKVLNSYDDGFFVGNFYADPAEKRTGAERSKLTSILKNAAMDFRVIKDPECPSSEYWVIGRGGSKAVPQFAKTLENEMAFGRVNAPAAYH